MFRFSLQSSSKIFLILGRIQRYIINVHRYSCKVYVIIIGLSWNLNILDRFLKNNQTWNFVTICPVGAELFRADGWIQDRKDEVVSRVSQYCPNAYSSTLTNWVCILHINIQKFRRKYVRLSSTMKHFRNFYANVDFWIHNFGQQLQAAPLESKVQCFPKLSHSQFTL